MDAGISDEKTIGPVNVLAIKAGLTIPYNIVRVLIDCIKHVVIPYLSNEMQMSSQVAKCKLLPWHVRR